MNYPTIIHNVPGELNHSLMVTYGNVDINQPVLIYAIKEKYHISLDRPGFGVTTEVKGRYDSERALYFATSTSLATHTYLTLIAETTVDDIQEFMGKDSP